jgi:3-dehydroquinate synthase
VPSDLRDRPAEIVQCMLLDKKTEGRELRFVLPSRLGHVETVRGVTSEQALSVL